MSFIETSKMLYTETQLAGIYASFIAKITPYIVRKTPVEMKWGNN